MHELELSDSGGTDAPGKKGPYPKSVFFIVGNEFCERFSYYGMRTVLTIYLSTILLYNDDDTKSIYHTFTMACYFTPLLGAIIADSWLGKFKTILYISIIYAIGCAVLSVGAFNFGGGLARWPSLLGLGLIALGTGGIKPCVAAFGGDQFVRGQEVYLEQFFSVFYICINAGSLLSTAMTPYLRAVHCNGQESCFSLAFGVPAALMVVSLALFVMGSPFYRKNPPGDNVIVKLVGCISRAVVNKFSGKRSQKAHWLDYADDRYDQKFVEEVKTVCGVLLIYLPVPIFWALFDQQGSSWTLQATRMRWKVFGVQILPDQIQLLNPLFILLLAPFFGYIMYPMLKKCGLLTKPLQKMIVGGILAASSFLVCMFLQFAVEAQESNAISFISTVPCNLNVSYKLDGAMHNFQLAENGSFLKINRPYPDVIDIVPFCDSDLVVNKLEYKPDKSHRVPREKVIAVRGNDLRVTDIPELGKGNVVDVKVFVEENTESDFYLTDQKGRRFNISSEAALDLKPIRFFRLDLVTDNDNETYTLNTAGSALNCPPQELDMGEGYSYIVSKDSCKTKMTQAAPSLSLIWQAPQYILITAGEVLFSVTGLEFSYSQAPKSMKSVLQAAWLMTVALGNLLVVFVAKIGLEKQSTEFLVFGLAMFADMILFAVLAYFYKPRNPTPHELSSSGDPAVDILKEPPPSA